MLQAVKMDQKMAFLQVFFKKGLMGAQRLARHLWRMCFALFMATASFFLGQSQFLPEVMQNIFILVTPVLLVILAMFYWLTRTLLLNKKRIG